MDREICHAAWTGEAFGGQDGIPNVRD